jgi:alpha-ribazole phosphatase
VKIHLIRHGETAANEKKLYCGRTDLPLTVKGIEEIAALKKQGVYPPPADMFFTSGLLRTEQTLEVIYGNVDRERVPGVAEFDFGLFEMKAYDELKDLEEYRIWAEDKTGDVECPGGESKNRFAGRVIESCAFIAETVLQAGSASATVLCHGGVIACIMEHYCPNKKTYYEWLPRPGRGYSLNYTEERFHEFYNI